MHALSRRGRDGSIVVGVGGISGCGKSTLADALVRKARDYGYSSECIGMDKFFKSQNRTQLPADTLEKLALSEVPCFREKRIDTNSPAAIDWPRFLSEISQKRSGPNAPDILFVEGFLVFCRDGAEELATGTKVFDAALFVSVSRPVAMERKRARSYPHVSPKEFEFYFDTVTYPNYVQYGRARPTGMPLFSYNNDLEPGASGIDNLLRKLLPVVVCVGDLHGWLDRTTSLFANLRISLPDHQFSTADVVFLGDYVDRGPQSNQTIEWIITSLPQLYPRQRHFFLAGNHELALIAALGDLPPPDSGFAAWSGNPSSSEKIWDGPGSENVHWQGRRYLSLFPKFCDIYNSAVTMSSYGIQARSIFDAHAEDAPAVLQRELQDKVPQSHRKFLMDCDWVIEFPARGSWLPKLTFVHAGLTSGSLEAQIACLRAKDCRDTRISQLSGRHEVLDTPSEIVASGGMLISGHHGYMTVNANRAIIDESGGCVGRPLAAMVLPFSDEAFVAGKISAADVASHASQSEVRGKPVFVYSGDFFEGLSMFWNLDAMWKAAYARARHDASVDIVLHVRDLARTGQISESQMHQWVNRQSPTSGYTLLHQVAWHNLYDIHESIFLEMGVDESITTLRTKQTAKEMAVARKNLPE